MRKGITAVFAAVLIVLLFAVNQADAAKKQMQKRLLSGNVAKENIEKVNQGIKWNTSLAKAEAEAKRSGKMILWLQMVGKMDGAT